MGFAYLLFLYSVFWEQPVFIGLYLYSWQTKNHEKILDNSRHQYLSLSARIILIAILVMLIQKSQGDASVLFGTRNSFCCTLFSTKLMAEFGKVFC